MIPPIRTISLIGNNPKGFTFIEVMISLVILSGGIVMIYKSYLLSVDHLYYLSCRLYASQMIEDKMSYIRRSFNNSKDLAFDNGEATVTMKINHRWIDFIYSIDIGPVSDLEKVYKLNVILSWHDGRRLMKLNRESLLVKI